MKVTLPTMVVIPQEPKDLVLFAGGPQDVEECHRASLAKLKGMVFHPELAPQVPVSPVPSPAPVAPPLPPPAPEPPPAVPLSPVAPDPSLSPLSEEHDS